MNRPAPPPCTAAPSLRPDRGVRQAGQRLPVIVFGRALFAVLALGLFARLAGQAWRALGPAQWLRLALCGLLLAGHWVSFFIAVKTAGVAIATLGFASFPAFTVILEGLLFRERIHLAEGLLVVLVSLGLVLVTPNFDLASGATSACSGRSFPACCSPCCRWPTVATAGRSARCRRRSGRTW